MSQRCMPFLLINMGGEMMYILEQRLKNVGEEKSQKVLLEILASLLHKKFVDELFKPQDMHSRRSMRGFFEKLAHSSIMRLNDTSMDKLFDLMTMTVKYQLQLISMPEQILTITLNHLDGMKELLPHDEELTDLLDHSHAMLMSSYRNCPMWELMLIRNCLLSFFQDSRVKVSLLLREKKQMDNGHFLLFPEEETDIAKDTDFPGSVRYYENGELFRTIKYPAPIAFRQLHDKENLAIGGKDRTTYLGRNIYRGVPDAVQVKGGGGTGKISDDIPAGDEMKLLTALMERSSEGGGSGDFELSLFADENEERKFAADTEKSLKVKRIDARKDKKSISGAMEEMKLDPSSSKKKGKGEDMLDLLDEAAARPSTAKKSTRGRSASKGSKERTSSAKRKPSK